MKETEKKRLLFDRLANFAGLPKIIFANTTDERTIRDLNEDYIFVTDLPRENESRGLTSVNDGGGILHCNVCIKLYKGEVQAARVVDVLRTAFPRGLQLGSVRFDRVGTVKAGFSDGARWVVPVQFHYRYIF